MLEFSLYRPKICLGVSHKRAKKYFSNNGLYAWLRQTSKFHHRASFARKILCTCTLCVDIFFKFTASGIHLCKTSRGNLLTWPKYLQELLQISLKFESLARIVNVTFQIRAEICSISFVSRCGKHNGSNLCSVADKIYHKGQSDVEVNLYAPHCISGVS